MPTTRRLAAILAADVAGYSRLMGADEEGTHERVKAHLRELFDPKISQHHGRIVKTTGDGVLAEFASVVDAVRCADEIQHGMADRNAETPADQHITFRIGINMGDVIIEPDDIYGEGVNIAARLEALAEPGGICISDDAFRQVRGKVDTQFVEMGERTLKNIARPVRVYAWRPEAVTGPPAAMVSPATSIPQPAIAPRLSIVVLPFANLNNDPEQQYFADAITEDLTADLSRIAGSLVISRNSAFTFRGKVVATRQIGRELDVRYVLEGSVRRSGDQVRINAQLIDAETDRHLWAERFDGDVRDLFELQDDVTSRIAVALNVELAEVEASRPTDNPDALDYILRARAANAKPGPTLHKYEEVIGLLERALALDPRSVEAQCLMASALAGRVMDQMTVSTAVDVARAEALVQRVMMAAPRNALAHWAKGQVLRSQQRYAEAILEYEAVISFDRNYVSAFGPLAECKLFAGSIHEMIPLHERAIRLSPRDPYICLWYFRIGVAHLLQSRIDKAIEWLERARGVNATLPYVHSYLASAYALKGEAERAIIELAEARKLSGDNRFLSFARLNALQHRGVPNIKALYEATYLAGLRKAGMPEE